MPTRGVAVTLIPTVINAAAPASTRSKGRRRSEMIIG